MAVLTKADKETLENQRVRLEGGLTALPRRVLEREDLRALRRRWAPSVGEDQFLDYLLEEGLLQLVELRNEKYPSFRRYALKDATAFEIALSLRKGSYLSHGSAVFLHGLTDQLPLRIYVNREQSPKPSPEGPLTQSAVDKAFSRPARETAYTFSGPTYEIALLNGKYTDRLEVGRLSGPDGELLDVTKLERTLIDITVRPNYAGGVYQVLEAFRAARERLQLSVLITTLRKLDYKYPYHQAIGLYMERAGYPDEALKRLEELGAQLDFYLTNNILQPAHSGRWMVFYPEGL